ncbi:MAG: 5'/3'-nucleotidase SurE [Vicingaceae bacterium]
MNKEPLILITNDDGITAPGISNLIRLVKKITSNCVVVAPDSPQSGMGHAITMNATLRLNETQVEGVKAYSCSGTPVDCVKIATSRVLDQKPDLIVSGINHGSNSSINVIYSGTMSAAVEGAIEGIPSIGFSLCNSSIDADFSPVLKYAEEIIRHTLKHPLQVGTCLNVNFPAVSNDLINGIKVCRQAKALWEEEFDERQDPSGNSYYWLTGKFVNKEEDHEDTDEWALKHNYVSVVPVHFDVTAYDALEGLKSMENEA